MTAVRKISTTPGLGPT